MKNLASLSSHLPVTPSPLPHWAHPWDRALEFRFLICLGNFFKKMLHGVSKPASYHPLVSLISTSITSFSRFYLQIEIPNKLFENGAELVSVLFLCAFRSRYPNDTLFCLFPLE